MDHAASHALKLSDAFGKAPATWTTGGSIYCHLEAWTQDWGIHFPFRDLKILDSVCELVKASMRCLLALKITCSLSGWSRVEQLKK